MEGNYTSYVLAMLGLVGVLLHNFVKMDSLNKQGKGKFSVIGYVQVEMFSILISVFVVGLCAYLSHEIRELEYAGKYLGLFFVALGYFAQSVLVKFTNRAQKMLDKTDTPPITQDTLDGYQQWVITTSNQNIVSIGGVAVNQSIQTYCNNNPDFAVQQCSPSEIYLYNSTMLSTQVTIVFSGDGSKQGVIIIAGHRKPPCAS